MNRANLSSSSHSPLTPRLGNRPCDLRVVNPAEASWLINHCNNPLGFISRKHNHKQSTSSLPLLSSFSAFESNSHLSSSILRALREGTACPVQLNQAIPVRCCYFCSTVVSYSQTPIKKLKHPSEAANLFLRTPCDARASTCLIIFCFSCFFYQLF